MIILRHAPAPFSVLASGLTADGHRIVDANGGRVALTVVNGDADREAANAATLAASAEAFRLLNAVLCDLRTIEDMASDNWPNRARWARQTRTKIEAVFAQADALADDLSSRARGGR